MISKKHRQDLVTIVENERVNLVSGRNVERKTVEEVAAAHHRTVVLLQGFISGLARTSARALPDSAVGKRLISASTPSE